MLSSRILKMAGASGILATATAFSSILIAIASWQPFSWFNSALSDLGVQQGFTAAIFNGGLVASGLFFFVFAVGLFVHVSKGLAKVGSIILMLSSFSLIAIGIFNENFRPTHYIVSVAFFSLMPLALLVLVAGFWMSGSRKLSMFTLASGLAAAVPWILQFSLNYVENVAIPEFVSGLAGAIWVVGLSFMMIKEFWALKT